MYPWKWEHREGNKFTIHPWYLQISHIFITDFSDFQRVQMNNFTIVCMPVSPPHLPYSLHKRDAVCHLPLWCPWANPTTKSQWHSQGQCSSLSWGFGRLLRKDASEPTGWWYLPWKGHRELVLNLIAEQPRLQHFQATSKQRSMASERHCSRFTDLGGCNPRVHGVN